MQEMCGYPREHVVIGVDNAAIDVGRNRNGELISVLDAPVTLERTPRLFSPSTVSNIEPEVLVSNGTGEAQSMGWRTRTLKKFRELWGERPPLGRRQALFVGVIAVLLVTVASSSLWPPSGTATLSANASDASPAVLAQPVTSTSSTATDAPASDPVATSIDLVLAGAVAGLGNMQSVQRSAVSATISSRAGDIVLVDIRVTKAPGLTAFATVLLQKVGSQWRMRQVVDERN